VERVVPYMRGNFFAGETFVDLADAQARAETWCAQKAGLRIHGTIHARPTQVFAEHEATVLLPAPEAPYEVPPDAAGLPALGLAKRYGSQPTDTACGPALELDVVSVTKIASMLERATENTPAPAPRAIAATAVRAGCLGVPEGQVVLDEGDRRRTGGELVSG
jgi:hypothetical protein